MSSALLAGAAGGLAAGLLQHVFVQPVLLQAEIYESGALVHFGVGSDTLPPPAYGQIDPVRDGLSVLFSVLTYCGFAMVLVAAMVTSEIRGAEVHARTGLLWGFAGFVAFHLAPAFTLPPELPGMAAGDLAGRQVWWFAAVAMTAAGLWLIAFGKSWAAWGLAILVLGAPHVIGAPEPDAFTGPAPPELGAIFATRTLGVSMFAWVILGCVLGHLWQKDARQAEHRSVQPS